jgi:MGT family glycosyltransferase
MRRLWPNFLVETVPAQMRDLEAALTGWPADALICDIAMWAPILILRERMHIPVIALSHVAHCILPGPDGPIQGVALPRRRGGWRAAFARLAAPAANLVTARTRRRANALRRRYGLAPLKMSVNQFTGELPLYLVPSAPEFDNCRRDLPPSVHYVGACLRDERSGDAAGAWVAETPRHWPILVVDEGALYTHEPRVLRLAARGLAGLPLTVILLAGEGRNPAQLDLGPLASNITLRAHTPLNDVLAVADVLVTNGNSESVLSALRAGLPMVVLPSIWDQAEMAWRVAETGAGLRVSAWGATPARMRRAVQRVLGETGFRENAIQMGAALERLGGPASAATLIEELLG